MFYFLVRFNESHSCFLAQHFLVKVKKNEKNIPVRFCAGSFLDIASAKTFSDFLSCFNLKKFFNVNELSVVKALTHRSSFLLGFDLSMLASFKTIVLVDFNIKKLQPLLAVRLRFLIKKGVRVYNFGPEVGIFGVHELGGLNELYRVFNGSH